MQHRTQLSKIMRLSWNIQRNKKRNRSLSLVAAWAIVSNEDITVQYLVQRHSHSHAGYQNKVAASSLTLFKS